jgi:hypothetical protein
MVHLSLEWFLGIGKREEAWCYELRRGVSNE